MVPAPMERVNAIREAQIILALGLPRTLVDVTSDSAGLPLVARPMMITSVSLPLKKEA